jgi:hypothetical protein
MRSFLLTAFSFLAVLIILNLGYYRTWFRDWPLQYWNDFRDELKNKASRQDILNARYGPEYTMCMEAKAILEKKKIAHPIILLEPNSYYQDSLHIPIRMPLPPVFYYYTGLTAVWTNSPEAGKANFLMRITKKGMSLEEITSPEQLRQILKDYQSFTPIL